MASPSPSTWFTINPQTRPLTLSILELTPLALTLSLTLSPTPASTHGQTPTSHIAHTHNHAHGPKHRKKLRHRTHSDDESDNLDADTHHLSPLPGSYPSALSDPATNFKDLLSHGVVVSVNGQSWNRIVAHVSEPEEDQDAELDNEAEEAEWEDEPTSVVAVVAGEEGGADEGMTKRRPRKARFGLSAGDAMRGEDKTVRLKRRPSEICKDTKVDRDRAVVVVYGLTPGKEYEIELQVVGLAGSEGPDQIVSNSVLIPPSPSPLGYPRSRANSLRSRSHPRSRSNSLTTPSQPGVNSHSAEGSVLASPGRATPPSNATAETHPVQPIPTNILNPIDTQAAQIRHMIAAAHAEKEHVQSQIKEARRASQRAEAALRLEIETVKKATEKAGSLDLRAKQKALALQEQVKQGWAGAENAEKEAVAVEKGLAEQETRLESVNAELDGVRDEWKAAKEKEEEVREQERKNRQEEEKKLQEIVGKIDKLKVKKDKKAAEKAELTKRLNDLLRQAEEVERRNEDERMARLSGGAYWWDPYSHGGHGHAHHGHQHVRSMHGQDHQGRTLTNHPSLNNLSGHAPGAQRGRGFPGRYPSAGSTRPTPSAPSPTHAPATNASPAFRGSKAIGIGSPAGPARTPSSSGVNVAAVPFHPLNPPVGSPSASTNMPAPIARNAGNATDHHTTLMPPQLQHRIYLPTNRLRPPPNFNPPPSVLAERQSPTILSAPSFPPLPGSTGSSTSASGSTQKAGPSLASIVTRAVLSPTAFAERGIPNSVNATAAIMTEKASTAAAVSAAILSGGRIERDAPARSPTYPLSPATASSSVSTNSAPGSVTGGSTPTPPSGPGVIGSRAVTFGPPPNRGLTDSAFSPPSNVSGPWAGLGSVRHRHAENKDAPSDAWTGAG